ncbi:MAG: GIY-YIG nuclease family protein, partial [Bacteroidota bacterium]
MPRSGYVYLLASKPNGTLYVGVTSDLAQRGAQHQGGDEPGFTRRYGVDHLVWFERHEDIRDAILREKQIKKWRREWKLDLIRQANPTWRDLLGDVVSHPREPLAMPDRSMDSRVRGNDEGEGWRGGQMLLALLLLLAASGCGEAPPESQLVGEGPEALVALAVEVDAPEADD